MRKSATIACLSLFLVGACGKEDGVAANDAPAPASEDDLKFSIENEDGSYREATPEEAEEMQNMALEAYQNLLDERPATKIAKDLDAHWRAEGRADTFDTSPYKYRITEGEMHTDLGAQAQKDGIKAASGFLAEVADAPFFRTVMNTYMTFDDKAAANAYFERLSRDMTGVAGPVREFNVAMEQYKPYSLRCVYVIETNNSVNCHYKGPDERVIGVLFFAEGPPLEFTGQTSAIDLIFENAEAAKRIAAVAGASWAYLNDAYY